ncbi:hypothetical protein CSKR_105488 [Clonorchis sinensis]|uniref:Uncharacterized protein n=1 Tax=Clonorchis sinensis TaxID=79923 RepID=A0A3R7D9R8_CLOSI|nr:hypothetical protein CSKR_105488 [Clonorchis sinensis]
MKSISSSETLFHLKEAFDSILLGTNLPTPPEKCYGFQVARSLKNNSVSLLILVLHPIAFQPSSSALRRHAYFGTLLASHTKNSRTRLELFGKNIRLTEIRGPRLPDESQEGRNRLRAVKELSATL